MYKSKEHFYHKHRLTYLSKDTVDRILQFALAIVPPKYSYHQTLTFPFPVTDASVARRYLEHFLKAICKQFAKHSFGAFFIQEQRKNESVHFHLFLFFFDEGNPPFSPTRMRTDLRTYLFKRWKSLTNDKIVYRANTLETEEFGLNTLKYFLKTVRVLDTASPRAEVNFWGKRGRKAFEQFSQPVSKAQVSAAFNDLFIKCRSYRPVSPCFSLVESSKPTVVHRQTDVSRCNVNDGETDLGSPLEVSNEDSAKAEHPEFENEFALFETDDWSPALEG